MNWAFSVFAADAEREVMGVIPENKFCVCMGPWSNELWKSKEELPA